MKQRLALILACCAAGAFAASCNESVEWDETKEVPQSVCKDGEKQCSNNAIMVCQNGEFVEEQKCQDPTPSCDVETHTCVAGKPVTNCTESDKKCQGNSLLICQNNNWKELEYCTVSCNATAKKCDSEVVGGKCDNFVATCTEGVLTTCDETNGEGTKNCEADEECGTVDGKAACVKKSEPKNPCTYSTDADAIELEDGETICSEDGELVTCNNGTLSSDTCDQGETCGEKDGEATCVPEVQNQSCTYGEGSDTVEIEDGKSICDGDGKLVTCDNGTLKDPAECGTGKFCDTEKKECADYTCTIGESTIKFGESACSADNKKIVKCGNGVLEDVENGDCDASSKVCMAGTSGFVCDVVSSNDCTVGTTTSKEGATKCNDAETNIEICTAGDFVPATGADACTANQICVTAEGVAKCEDKKCTVGTTDYSEGDKKCNEAGTNIEICTSGEFVPATDTNACTENQICVVEEEVAKCQDLPVYNTIKKIKDDIDVVAAAEKATLDAKVNVTGVVTAVRTNGTNLFFQDSEAGIYIYNASKKPVDLSTFAIGDKVTVTAPQIQLFGGQLELVGATVVADGTENVTPAEITDISTILETTEKAVNPKNLMLVTVKNVTASEVTNSDNKTVTAIKDASNNTIYYSTYIDKNITFSADFIYDVTGIVNFNKTNKITVAEANGLAPRSAADVVAVGCVDTTKTFVAATATDPAKCEAKVVPPCEANKCVEGKIQVCTEGTLAEAVDCSGIANAKTYGCNTAGNACIALTCEDDYTPATDGLSCESTSTGLEGTECDTPNEIVCDPATGKFNKCTSIGYWGSTTDCSAFEGLNPANASTFGCNTENNGCVIKTCTSEDYTLNADGLSCKLASAGCGKDMNDKAIENDTYFCVDSKHVGYCDENGVRDETFVTWSKCDQEGYVCNPDTIDGAYGLCEESSTPATTCKDVNDHDVAVDAMGCKDANTAAVCTATGWDLDTADTCVLGCDTTANDCKKCTTTGFICEGNKAILCTAGDKPKADEVETCKDADHCSETDGCLECTSDSDCAAVEGKSACDLTNHTCVAKTCTDAVSGLAVAGSGKDSVGCATTTSFSVCKNGVWSVEESDVVACAEGKTCDPTSITMDCKDGGSEPKIVAIDFSVECTEANHCKKLNSKTSYEEEREYKVDDVAITVKGSFSDTGIGKGYLVLTGNTGKLSKIDVTGLAGVNAVSFEGISYNPSGKKKLNITVGETTDVYDFSAIANGAAAIYTHDFNDADATSVLIQPDGSTTGNADSRIVIKTLAIAVP